MKIAIHNATGGFAPHWIRYCQENSINYKLVNAYDTNIIDQLSDCDAFMWHHNHGDYRDKLFAKQLLAAIEASGKVVFPNHNSGWHFDDKVGEKYLFESLNLPIVPSYVFYNEEDALRWIENNSFPKVFKLRGGAGSSNVRLVDSKKKAKQLVAKSFNSGFPQFDKWEYFCDRLKKWRSGTDTFVGVCKGLGRLFIAPRNYNLIPNEKGYIYFQDFIPDNQTDFRVKVIGDCCWAFQRQVRKNDFRASGGGKLIFDNSKIPESLIKLAFECADKAKLQCVAFDFILDKQTDKFMLVESSYGFGFDKLEYSNGYWDKNIVFHKEKFNPFGLMVKTVVDEINND